MTDFGPARPWPWRAAVSEGVRSALLGRWFSGIAVLLIAWASAVPGAADATVVSGVVAQETRFVDAGGYVMFAVAADQAANDPGVSASACENLSKWTGVLAAAHVKRLPEPVALSIAPGHEIPAFAVSAAMWGLLGATHSPTRDAILSTSIANRIGVRDGDWLALRPPATADQAKPSMVVRVTVADTSILGEDRTGILLPVTTLADDYADACVVAAQPSLHTVIKAAIPAAVPSRNGLTVVRDRLITGTFNQDYSALYRERATQWAWLAAGGLLGMVWLLIGWVRRSDDALYAMMGADLATRALVRGTEWALLLVLGAIWAVPLGVTLALVRGAPFDLALTYVARDVAATALLATTIVLIGLLRRPRSLLADLKDR